MAGGRPTGYTLELGDKICQKIAEGNSLRKICTDKSMPCAASVYKWRREHQEFTDNYARAREDAADVFAEEIIEIADDTEPEMVQVAKLRTDTRKWIASRFNRAYMDKQSTEHTGANGGAIVVDDMSTWTNEQIDAYIAKHS